MHVHFQGSRGEQDSGTAAQDFLWSHDFKNAVSLRSQLFLKGNSGEKMNFFHVKGLIISWRVRLVVCKNCVRDFRFSMLK